MTAAAWKVLSHTTVFRGGPVEEIAVETVRLPDGRVIDDYYTIQLRDYVLIFPEWPDGTVSMFRQYRHGLRRVCLGFPGGAIDAGEAPIDAARRELLEELGCEADEWRNIGALTTNGNQGCNRAHLFHAAGCRHVSAPLAPDLERPELVTVDPDVLLVRPEVLQEVGLATHVALLLIATQPRLSQR